MTVRFGTHDSEFCARQLNLLAHAQAIELDVGSECGGHGVCGKDRVRIAEGDRSKVSPVTDRERSHLSSAELAEGWRLACQAFPEADDSEIQATPRVQP